jgi:hypothetical protein
MKQIGSEITTSLAAPASGIGMQLGEHGLATPADLQMAGWLSRRSPEEVSKVAVSRASQHNVALRMRTEWRYPQDRPSYEVLVQCQMDGPAENKAALVADLERLMTPAPIREIEGWLAELSVIVARRPQEEVDEAVRLTAYSSRLAQYPADVARHVLLEMRWKFWPTWEELASAADGLTSTRKVMIAAAEGMTSRPSEAYTERDVVDRAACYALGERYLSEKTAEGRRARKADERKPHWSEAALPDDPRWEMLRKSRAEARA